MAEPRECSSPGYRARTGPREALACKRERRPLAPSRPAILGILCPGRRQPAQSLLLSGLVQPRSLLGELPPSSVAGARTPGFPAPPGWVSAFGLRLVLSLAHLLLSDAGVPRGGRVLGSGGWTELQWGTGWRRQHRGNQTALSGPEPPPSGPYAEEGRMFLPRAWPAGARCGGLLFSNARAHGPRGRLCLSRARASCKLGGRGRKRLSPLLNWSPHPHGKGLLSQKHF